MKSAGYYRNYLLESIENKYATEISIIEDELDNAVKHGNSYANVEVNIETDEIGLFKEVLRKYDYVIDTGKVVNLGDQDISQFSNVKLTIHF